MARHMYDDLAPRSNLPKKNALNTKLSLKKTVKKKEVARRYSGPLKRYTKAGHKAGKY